MPSDDLIDKTIGLFEPGYGRKLTRKEAHEILNNLTGFFEIRAQVDAEVKARVAKLAALAPLDAPDER